MKKLIYCLLLLPSLLTLSGCSFDGGSITTNGPVANHTDLSVSYLQLVFGDVGNVIHGTSGQMLGHLFEKFNYGILCVAGLWLSYTTFTILMYAASAELQQKKPGHILLRVGLGIALIIPNSTTGYSGIQDILMKVVVEGVNLADMVWDSGLIYLKAGGAVWHQPKTIAPHQDRDYATLYDGIMGTAADWSGSSSDGTNCIFGQNCELNGLNTNTTDPAFNPHIRKAPIGTKLFIMNACMANYSFYHPLRPPLSSHLGYAPNPDGGKAVPALIFPSKKKVLGEGVHDEAGCGYVPLNKLATNDVACTGNIDGDNKWMVEDDTSYSNMVDSSGNLDKNKARCIYLKLAVQQMASTLMPAARRYMCSTQPGFPAFCAAYPKESDQELINHLGETTLSAFLDYVTAVTPMKNLGVSSQGHTTGFLRVAHDEGWASAGRFYWDLARLGNKYDNNSNDAIPHLQPSFIQLPALYVAENSQLGQMKLSKVVQVITAAKNSLDRYTTTNQKGATGNDNEARHDVTSAFNGVLGRLTALAPFASGLMDVVHLFLSFTDMAKYGGLAGDPIVWLSNLGFYMIGTAINLYVSAAGMSLLIAGAASICNGEVNGSAIFQTGFSFVTPLFWCAMGPLFIVGCSFGYFLPLYPWLLYTFGVIAWIVAVIEAMVAAPLVAFGLTHPDGHDFLGEAKQAMMLALSIFLRPTLMVIGLIAGMIVSYVSLRIVVYSFDSFLTDLYTPGGTYKSTSYLSPLTSAFVANWNVFTQYSRIGGVAQYVLMITTIPMLLIVFASIVYQITTNAFNLIHLIPQHTLRWIGAPQDPTLADALKMTQAVEGTVKETGQNMKEGLSHATSNIGNAIATYKANSKDPGGFKSE